MTSSAFAGFIGGLCEYFERRKPSDATMALWYDKCRSIPNEPLQWIASKIQESEAMPKNPPAAVWAIYHQWLQAYPEKRQKKQDRYCPVSECENGLLHASKFDEEMSSWHDFVFRCPCQRSELHGIPYSSKHQLVESGHVFGRLPEKPAVQPKGFGLDFSEIIDDFPF